MTDSELLRGRQPDRVAALKQTHEAPTYLAFLVERADAGRRDPVRHSTEDVEAEIEALLAAHGG